MSQTCTECGFPMDTPERAHAFIHQMHEALLEHRKILPALRQTEAYAEETRKLLREAREYVEKAANCYIGAGGDPIYALLARIDAALLGHEIGTGNPNALADDRRNWSEDFSHENGNYQNQCVHCGLFFIGHKRRVICKLCAVPVHAVVRLPSEAQDALRWRWWLANGMSVARDDPANWTCWLTVPWVPYRSQTTDPNELTDALLARFPLDGVGGLSQDSPQHEQGDPAEGDPMTWLRRIVVSWMAGGDNTVTDSRALQLAAEHFGLLDGRTAQFSAKGGE